VNEFKVRTFVEVRVTTMLTMYKVANCLVRREVTYSGMMKIGQLFQNV